VAGENVEPRLLAQVATAPHPPRVIAVYRRADLPGPEARPVTLGLWRVADPGNVGTLIRTADAFGAAVALSEGCADPTGPKALRASAGSIWRVPVGRLEASEASRGVKRVASSHTAASPSTRSTCTARWSFSSAPSAKGCRLAGPESSRRGSRSRAPSR